CWYERIVATITWGRDNLKLSLDFFKYLVENRQALPFFWTTGRRIGDVSTDLDPCTHLGGLFHGRARFAGGGHRAAGDPPRPWRNYRRPPMDDDRVHPHVRGGNHHGSGTGRPAGQASCFRQRARPVHDLLGRLCSRTKR